MPCEGCASSFTVFRRKRSCSACKRFYCGACLSTSRRNLLCERCAIFAKRPLLRADLLQLKPKDLIFYLQSKHISTAGCVEKDELVGLILAHIQQAEASSPGSSNGSSSSRSERANPKDSFDSLKQTCQNFFTNISDNISDSFAAFDGKSGSKSQPNNANVNSNNSQRSRSSSNSNGGAHIIEQPRVRTRTIPSYASFQSYRRASQTSGSQTTHAESNGTTQRATLAPNEAFRTTSISPDAPDVDSNNQSSSTSSPVNSSNSSSNASQPLQRDEHYVVTLSNEAMADEVKSDCECSDDEIFTAFSTRVATKDKVGNQCVQQSADTGNDVADTEFAAPSSSSSTAAQSQSCRQESKLELAGIEADESSHSSFEELGAIGGISDESKAATDTDQWQMLDAQRLLPPQEADTGTVAAAHETAAAAETNMLQLVAILQPAQAQPPPVPQRVKKVTRRRSDGYLNRRRRPLSDDESPTSSDFGRRDLADALTLVHEQAEDDAAAYTDEQPMSGSTRQRINCNRCGKNKSNLRRHVEKMRCHLQSSQMSEADIKRELCEFLAYLEKRTASLDCSDTETAASSLSGVANCVQTGYAAAASPLSPPSAFDDNEGIHVYAACSDYTGRDVSRFINLEDFDTLKELESLTVKQLKEVLMLNRVDYKGCCEKQELLDRVERLWKNLKSSPAVDKLQTDELCKICMDAPIECIILECGHMATCTGCGKVLSECPICRQYIVRVVRFFRA